MATLLININLWGSNFIGVYQNASWEWWANKSLSIILQSTLLASYILCKQRRVLSSCIQVDPSHLKCVMSFIIHSFGHNSVSHEGAMTVLAVVRTMSNLKELR